MVTTNSYNEARGWLMETRSVVSGGSAVLQNVAFVRAATGRIERIDAWDGPGFAYGYDTLDRLLTAAAAAGAGLSQSFTYAATQAGPYAMSYDVNGNRLTRTGGAANQSVVWDGENRPASITVGAIAHLFAYGPDGHRLKKRTPNGTGGSERA